MNVRPATPADNPALLDLAKTLSLPGIVRFGVDRGPDFFALDRMMSGETLAVVAEAGNDVVGFIDACILPADVCGRRVKALHICLAGMREDHRGRGKFLPLLAVLEQRAREAGCEAGFSLTNESNTRVQAFVPAWPHGATFCEPIDLHVILGPRRREPASAFTVRCGTTVDLPGIESLVRAHRGAYDFAPALPHGVTGVPDLEPSDFLVADNANGEMVACLALWDQTDWRRTPVVSYGAPLRIVKPLIDGAAGLFGRPRLPRVGEHFRFSHAAFPAAAPGGVQAFTTLLHAAVRELAHRNQHFIALGLPASDPLVGALANFVSLKMRATPFLAAGSQRIADDLARCAAPRAWFDYALV